METMKVLLIYISVLIVALNVDADSTTDLLKEAASDPDTSDLLKDIESTIEKDEKGEKKIDPETQQPETIKNVVNKKTGAAVAVLSGNQKQNVITESSSGNGEADSVSTAGNGDAVAVSGKGAMKLLQAFKKLDEE